MTEPQGYDGRERVARRGRKLRDLALLLPLCGAIAFTSPVLDAFASANIDIGHKVIYVFGCWIVLIVCAFLLSRALRAEIRDK
jgi:hypothetical protein